jgi:hypothetical protein
MSLNSLRTLLGREHSFEVHTSILAETALLYREEHRERWFFLLLNRVFAQVADNSELYEADTAEPVLEVIGQQASSGIDAIERGDVNLLISAANQITETYCGIP